MGMRASAPASFTLINRKGLRVFDDCWKNSLLAISIIIVCVGFILIVLKVNFNDLKADSSVHSR